MSEKHYVIALEKGYDKEDIMNDIQPEKVALSFGLYVLSKQSDDDIQMYLDDFREMFFDMLKNKSKDELPNGDTKDPVVQQHNDDTISRDVEIVTQTSMTDLKDQLSDMSLDKSSWKKVFMEHIKWV